MTERERVERQSSKTAKGVTVTGISLVALMGFGTWIVKIANDAREGRVTAAATAETVRYITEERWRADSVRRDNQFLELLSEVRDLRMDNAQRLREICVALRAGCR